MVHVDLLITNANVLTLDKKFVLSQRKWVQIIVLLYLLCSMGLTLLAPSLMLNLINTAYYGFGQFLPGLLSIFFFRSIRPAGIAAGLIAGDLFAICMHLAQINFLNINFGLIALLINFTVIFAISMYLKRKQKAQTTFEEPIAYNNIEVEETYPKKLCHCRLIIITFLRYDAFRFNSTIHYCNRL
ncbi:hypothetical protein ACFX4I_16965 [Peribacillus sp. YIM B13472]|uniref:hypothetical protein n=1 Tax=Peribacillus sp. YIM B13472 TaxID=3366297 RepID=UPI00366D05E2